MGSLIQRDKDTARKKGTMALVTTAAGVTLAVTGAPILGLPVVGFGAWLAYDWFMFRAKRGMRF
ncbi:MAG: hypothetical protein AB2A00_26510 [Myxococcota bacterium]